MKAQKGRYNGLRMIENIKNGNEKMK